MSSKSTGRGAVALVGGLLMVAGLAAGFVLFLQARSRPDDVVGKFARAQVGCNTLLEFKETGTFYAYHERHTTAFEDAEGCAPDPAAFGEFTITLTDDSGTPVSSTADTSISYESDGITGESVSRFEITEPGDYVLNVSGEDELTVAALGRDPEADVASLQRYAIIAAVAGLVLGLVLLLVSGRGSRKASTPVMPEGPGWGPAPLDRSAPAPVWPPVAPQIPINPTQPDQPVAPEAPPAPLPSRTPVAPTTPWAPPAPGSAVQAAGSDDGRDDRLPPRRPAT